MNTKILVLIVCILLTTLSSLIVGSLAKSPNEEFKLKHRKHKHYNSCEEIEKELTKILKKTLQKNQSQENNYPQKDHPHKDRSSKKTSSDKNVNADENVNADVNADVNVDENADENVNTDNNTTTGIPQIIPNTQLPQAIQIPQTTPDAQNIPIPLNTSTTVYAPAPKSQYTAYANTECYNAQFDLGYTGISDVNQIQKLCDNTVTCSGAVQHGPNSPWWLLSSVHPNSGVGGATNSTCISKNPLI
jgi:hypothetical protein